MAAVLQRIFRSFGVLVSEVMSRGQQPYAEFASLAEVADRVKGGHTMIDHDRGGRTWYTTIDYVTTFKGLRDILIVNICWMWC